MNKETAMRWYGYIITIILVVAFFQSYTRS